VTKEPANGKQPSSSNGSEPDDDRTPFERFASLTKRLVSVPKNELDEARERSKQPD